MTRLQNPARRGVRRTLKIIAILLASVLLIAVVGFVAWAETPLGPKPDALAALKSGSGVSIAHTAAGWEFAPDSGAKTGVVFYPGGHVDARSYAPLARALAERGYLVIITPVTLNLAIFSPNVGDAARTAHPEVTHWGIIGHSLGGVMAASHVAERPGVYSALIFLAAYPIDGTDLTGAVPKVASLYGDRDAGLNLAKVESTKSLLPSDTTFTMIPGANHAQWGSYGPQPGDLPATIGAAEQLTYAVDAVQATLGPAR